MGLFAKLAWRNIWRNKRRSVITAASILFAVFIAVMARSIAVGVFGRMINHLVSSFSGYIQVHHAGYFDSRSLDDSFFADPELIESIELVRHVTFAVPRLETFALVSSGDRTDGARILGIDPEIEDRMTTLTENIAAGRYLQPSDKGVLLGAELARHLQVEVGDEVALLGSGYQAATAAGRYTIVGTIALPVEEMSAALVWMPLAEAQWLFNTGDRITTLALHIDDPRHLERIHSDLANQLDRDLESFTWKQIMPELDQFVTLKYRGQDFIIGLIYVIVGFGVFGTILMMTMERLREFGMVTALGMRRGLLVRILILESTMLTLVGAIAATLVTWPILIYMSQHPIRLTGSMEQAYREYGFEPLIAFALQPEIFVWQTIIVILIAFVASVYPVVRVMRLNPVVAMRTGH